MYSIYTYRRKTCMLYYCICVTHMYVCTCSSSTHTSASCVQNIYDIDMICCTCISHT